MASRADAAHMSERRLARAFEREASSAKVGKEPSERANLSGAPFLSGGAAFHRARSDFLEGERDLEEEDG